MPPQYQQVEKERYDMIVSKYEEFLNAINDVNKKPVRVFDPLPNKHLQEIALIRQISQELQKKKDDDMKMAAQAAEQVETKIEKPSEKRDVTEDEGKKSE